MGYILLCDKAGCGKQITQLGARMKETLKKETFSQTLEVRGIVNNPTMTLYLCPEHYEEFVEMLRSVYGKHGGI